MGLDVRKGWLSFAGLGNIQVCGLGMKSRL